MINLKTNNREIKNIETVLFDKDGTFIDLHYFWGKMTEFRAIELVKRYNLPSERITDICLKLGYNPSTGRMLSDGITALYSRPIIIGMLRKDLIEMNVPTTEEEIAETFDYVNEIFYKQAAGFTKPIAPAINFIKKIRKLGVKTGVVTADTKASTLATLKQFGWEELFDIVIGRECCEEPKESGIPFKLALELLGSSAETTIMVGDTPMDCLGAKNADIQKTILVSTGQIEKTALSEISPYAIDSLDEVELTDSFVSTM